MATSTAWHTRSCTCCATRTSAPGSARPGSGWWPTASTSACLRSASRSSIAGSWRGRSALSTDHGAPAERQPSLGRVVWDAWRAYTHRAGAYQAQVLLSAVYYVVVGPSVVVARLCGTRLLDLDRGQRGSYWIER